MIELQKIKLIIWDLDNTLWDGVLSEGDVVLKKNILPLLSKLKFNGVICSICSKNNIDSVNLKLAELGIKEFFVFASADWSSKGQRIKQIISCMGLREQNVLFVDDEQLNLEEAKFYCPNIMVSDPGIIEVLLESLPLSSKDKSNRLEEYKLLEKKTSISSSFDSPVEFLKNSNIQVCIHQDCLKYVDRIHELLNRTNQLNYTKNRLTLEETKELLLDSSCDCGVIECCDKYGYYGFIGFYAVQKSKLIHFAFSCRCLGMGVEQFVYAYLRFPDLVTIGEVAVNLNSNDRPCWIKLTRKIKNKSQNSSDCSATFKGPCDMEQLFSYISDSKKFTKEFNYVSKKKKCVIYQGTHSTTILQSLILPNDQKNAIASLPFYDDGAFETKIYTQQNGYIFISLIPEGNYACYKNKKDGTKIIFGEWCDDLTQEANINKYLKGQIFTGGCVLSRDFFKQFSNEYCYLGRLTPRETCDNYKLIVNNISSTNHIYFILPSEISVDTNQVAYTGREKYHKELNSLVVDTFKQVPNVSFISTTAFAPSKEFYTNNLNHYQKSVYFKMSKEIIKIFANKGIIANNSNFFERILRKVLKKIRGK